MAVSPRSDGEADHAGAGCANERSERIDTAKPCGVRRTPLTGAVKPAAALATHSGDSLASQHFA